MSDDWQISPYERSRRAPLHFWARADNARFTAYILSKAAKLETVSAMADDIGYGGTPSIATYEAFVREASLSLELIIKGVIARRLEVGEKLGVTSVPANHNVPQLWDHAKLPKPSDADYGRLVQARVYLMWASRYPAPLKDEHGDKDSEEIQRYATERLPNSKLFRKPRSFAWDDIRRIYSVVHDCFWEIRNAHFP